MHVSGGGACIDEPKAKIPLYSRLGCALSIAVNSSRFGQPITMMRRCGMRLDIGEVGLTVVEHVFNEMKVDSEWSTVQEDGFTWWGKDFAQKVWAEPAIKDDGFWISRLHARTDIAAGFKATPENIARLSALNRFASLSALIADGSDASEIRHAASM